MILTVYEGYDRTYLLLGSKDERFHRAWGNVVRVNITNAYQELSDVVAWVNNELGEEALFELD